MKMSYVKCIIHIDWIWFVFRFDLCTDFKWFKTNWWNAKWNKNEKKNYVPGYCHSVGGVLTVLWTFDTPIETAAAVATSEEKGIMVEFVPV